MSPFTYFAETLTEDEAKKLRKRLALQYHPDVADDGGATMRNINTEFERWLEWKLNPPILVPAPTSNWASPEDWWSAIANASHQKAATQPPPRPTPSPPPQAATPPSQAATPPPPLRRSRSAGPSRSATQREMDDYFAAQNTYPDSHGHRVFGIVTILYTAYLTGLTIEALEIRGSNPRHQIRESGTVVYERPATRAWQAERRDLIARATARNY
ncbi:hypothetical protein K2Z83_20375 [Oscillochloris sp. ZM17-4]|uniref:hypothetical protein n=1 Tax=Oscillochloris sp. ZM17-4 TaxID=2866714 RepID=UPI001C734B13|nr:hypothetical protein [Oscillochloris sp. ZM17-4]MBX0330028.1 hypothetical protein [Oscillochloris sp. ZM17-4]